MDDRSNTQPVAVITGGSGGIGRAVARYLLQQQYRTILIARNIDQLTDLQAEFSAEKVQLVSCDLRDSQAITRSIGEIIANNARVDLLINSAGYVKAGTSDLTHDEFIKMLDTNLVGLFDVTNAIIPIMRQQRQGRIINISSYNGVVASARLGGYSASKFGLMGLNEAWHKELAPYGIYVTAICPNLVDTDMISDVTSIEKSDLMKVEDIVKTISYLLSLSPNVLLKELVLRCRAKLIDTNDS